jgi:hypothetical protein
MQLALSEAVDRFVDELTVPSLAADGTTVYVKADDI